ncbi:MAG: AarF/ABC1/UbiB kinase family protein [Calditerrivibrio sp.]|nr:AarF/ABC1/UbiB kinase family protein [Calditerrivibrio sp.]MCA1932885.1 AarF/ABC1/UbiB kinase family protein [Calditerrivibrio sp.]MCA1979943.1 AarF/ABC1/UbiB kinase family protein [Calditerrivibrio sp.]
MINIHRAIGNVKRFRDIGKTFLKYGFGPLIYEMNLAPLLGFLMRFISPKIKKEIQHLPASVRLRKLFEELGTTYIKFGQFLASRPDIFPEEVISELRKLQDHTLYFPFDQIKPVIESSINKPIKEVFEYIEEIPMASASIAQVHKGKMLNGQFVAIKIKKPGVKKLVEQDISILMLIGKIAEKHIQEARQIQLVRIIEEMSEQINKELNFELEIFYIEKFSEFFKNDTSLIFPKVYKEFSSNDIIVMDMIQGVRIDHVSALEEKEINLKEIASKGVNFYLKQVFEFGFFHADPHPGNLLITDDGKIAILDFGIIGKIDSELLEHLSDIFLSLIKLDINSLVNEMIEFGVINPDMDIRKIKLDLMDVILPVYGKNIGEIDSMKILQHIITIGRKYRFNFPIDYIYIIKTFAFLESIGKKLDPEFDVLHFTKPYAKRIIKQKYSLKNIVLKSFNNGKAYAGMVTSIPEDYKKIVSKVLNDKITFNFVHRGLEKFATQIDKSVNRLSFSIVIAGIILSSSIMVYANVGPKIFGMSVLGLSGFIVSSFLGLGLIIGIIRSGKLW